GMIQVWATEAEPAFARWTQWAAQRSAEYGLGDTPKAVSETFWGLVARADKEPIELDGMKVDGDMIRAARGVFFYPAQATPMVVALKAAAEGKPLPADVTGTQLKRLLGGAAAEPASDNGTAVFWAVACGDTGSWPRYTEQYERDAAKDKAKYPLYGDFASNIKPCAFWDRPAEAATPMNKKANVLTVQNEWDSQTPLVSSQGLHRALKGSRMVLAAGGEGHGVYLFDPTSCANAPVNAYLTTGRLPDRDVTCQNPPAAAERRDAAAPSKRLPFPSGPARF
ncbi:alpha/beta hydrolase, partial [Streptomyces avidinii]